MVQSGPWAGSIRDLGWVGFRFAWSERDFSSVGHTLTDPRSQLSAAKVGCTEIVRWGLRAGLV